MGRRSPRPRVTPEVSGGDETARGGRRAPRRKAVEASEGQVGGEVGGEVSGPGRWKGEVLEVVIGGPAIEPVPAIMGGHGGVESSGQDDADGPTAAAGGDVQEERADPEAVEPGAEPGAGEAEPQWWDDLDEEGLDGGEAGGLEDEGWEPEEEWELPEEAWWECDSGEFTAPKDTDWATEKRVCACDPGYFCDQYGVIDKPKAPGLGNEQIADELEESHTGLAGTVRFRLWPGQVGVMGSLVKERLIVILKARQLGISWLVCAYVLWVSLFHSNQVVFLYSKGQSEANELLRRIKALFTRLPEKLREKLPYLMGKDNTRELGFSNGSVIRSMPATRTAGISFTASLVVLDEWAHQIWGGALYESVKPIMEAGGQLVIMSTANGMSNWFHELWSKAVRGANSFKAIFLPWWARPGRDMAWYARVMRDSNDPNRVKENYPSNPVEAFRATGSVRFAHEWIEAQAPNVRRSLPVEQWPGVLRGVPGLRIYKLPEPGHRYVVSADVAEGKETSNYDAATVVDRDTKEEMALLHGQWEPTTYAIWLIALADAYAQVPTHEDLERAADARSRRRAAMPLGRPLVRVVEPESKPAIVLVERNNHGHAVLGAFKLKGFTRVALGHDGYPGWVTNPKTKPMGVDLLAEALKDATILVRSLAALLEFGVYKRLKDGTTGAEPPDYDDIVMSWVIVLSWLQQQEVQRTNRTAKAVSNPLQGYRG